MYIDKYYCWCSQCDCSCHSGSALLVAMSVTCVCVFYCSKNLLNTKKMLPGHSVGHHGAVSQDNPRILLCSVWDKKYLRALYHCIEGCLHLLID